MNNWQIFLILFCGIALAQSVFLGAMMFVRDRLNRGTQFYLGLMLMGLAFRLVKSYFVFVPQAYPQWGVVVGGAGLWLIGPAFYFYTRKSLQSCTPNTFRHLVHFLPSALFLSTGTTAYVYYVGLLQFAVYFAYSMYLARAQRTTGLPKHFRVFAVCTGLMLLCFIVQASQGGIRIYTIGVGIAICILYVINFFIVTEGDFLKILARKTKALDSLLATKIISDLTQVLTERKIYRNKGLKVSELAKEANYPAYLISQSINQQYHIRFNEFLNKFRVQEAMERLSRNDENDKIEIIAREVGFSSSTSLYEAFKKETNLTPQVFRNRFSGR